MPKARRKKRRNLAADWQRWGGYALLAVAVLVLVVFLIFRGGRRETYGQPWLEFSGEKALAHVQALVDLGPRPAGSAALKESRNYIKEKLEAEGWQVELQTFVDDTPRGKIAFMNLIARRPNEPKRGPLFLLCSHYDTKTFDDFKFVGADDGGSSTGALLEMARVLNLHPELAARIELVFFDGEEAFDRFSATDGLYGSRHFAEELKKKGSVKRYRGAILWDMIGDKNLAITLSPDSPAQLTQDIFAAATALNARNHFTYANTDLLDDHNPLNRIGIPAIDLIDFDYPPWHTAEDTMDKISAESLQTIGAVTAYYLAEMAFR